MKHKLTIMTIIIKCIYWQLNNTITCMQNISSSSKCVFFLYIIHKNISYKIEM